jgi:hypothetical protein
VSAVGEKPRARAALKPPAAARGLLLAIVVFVALVLARQMSEGVYDIAFANVALDFSGLVSTVTLVYFVGFGVEICASLVAGPLLDRGSPAATLVGAYLAKTGVFLVVGYGSTFFTSRLWTIVAAAATVDLVHRVGEMALFVLLPRLLDGKALVKVQGIGAVVRAVGDLLSPTVAGVVLVVTPGARALVAAAGFQMLALVLFGWFVALVRRRNPAPGPAAEHDPAPDGQASPAPVSRRAVARTIRHSRSWRRFVVLDTLATLALSAVFLTLIPMMREQLDMSPARSGVFMAFSSLGAVLGGLVVTRSGEGGLFASLGWAPALAGAGTVIAATLGSTPWVLAVALTFFGMGFTVYLRSGALAVQLRAPQALLGTWHGIIDAIERVASAATILVTGYLFDAYGGTVLYSAFGGLLLLTGALWWAFDEECQAGLSATPFHAPATTPTSPGA